MERNETLKTEILGYAHDWVRCMDMAHFTINHTFRDGLKDDDPDVCGETEAYPQYRQARITWYLASCFRLEPSELENVVVHELVHVALSPLESQLKASCNEYTELGVENIARALINVRRQGNGQS